MSPLCSWPLEADPEAPGRARRLVTETLKGWGRADVDDVAALLTSEVVTNAVQYAGSRRLALHLSSDGDGRVRVSCDDDGSGRARLEAPGRRDAGGYGLRLVDQLAASWGTERLSAGKRVWFELELAPTEPR